MDEVFNISSLEWQPIRPDITQGVYGKSLLAEGIKLTLTRVSAGGKFDRHQDKYGHLFYFLSGEGIVQLQDKNYKITPGLVVNIAAGEPHSYENTGDIDLMLISVNLPIS
jgi:mannose-6-phosphate isomerase-like protein (cupin superfamily)